MKKPGLLASLLPLVLLITLLVTGSMMFGDDMTGGPAQFSLLTAAMLTCFLGIYIFKVPWSKFEKEIGTGLSDMGMALIIVLLIGAVNSAWMLSGVVPTIICYGLKIISPKLFLAASFLLCGVVGFMLGSSWTTVGTIGLAMLGAGRIIGLPDGWLAGAILSGAYLGDKLSPLSDTTIMASSVAGVDLYKHIRYMLITTIPAVIITLVVFLFVGFTFDVSDSVSVAAQSDAIRSIFVISPWLLLVPVLTIVMLVRKVNVLLTLFVSALCGAILAILFQPDVMAQVSNTSARIPFLYDLISIITQPHKLVTGSDMVDTLASTGGMQKMLNTVWLLICVSSFGGIMRASGMLGTITTYLLKVTKTTFSLVTATICTCFCCEFVMADQYTSILIPGKMFKEAYDRKGLQPELLSRSLEDCGTVCSVLCPWNTCGVMQASVLGIATLTYAPFCIFNIVSPIMGIVIAALGYKIDKPKPTVENE